MDSINATKRQKLNEEQDLDVCEKSLSELPDAVLHHILSFLPTKEAVRTSILSKRWEYLWSSISNLEFDQYGDKRTHLMDFVDRVFSLRDSDIKRFHIACDVQSDVVRIRRWISAAVKRNVQDFHIYLYDCVQPFALPHYFFTCASVKRLHLLVSYPLMLPPSICFPNLKILHLKDITFPDNHSAQKLFSCLPVLEEMKLSQCNWAHVNIVSICSPKLWRLNISDMEIFTHCWNESDGCQIMIFGTCLKIFKYSGKFLNNYCLYDTYYLDEAHIQMRGVGPRSRVAVYRLYKLLREISDVKKLRLSDAAIKALNHAPEIFDRVPLFNNLSNLQLNSADIYLDCKALLKILQNSPCLKAIEFSEGIGFSPFYKRDQDILDPVPPCFLLRLKTIVVWELYGEKDLLRDAVKILLNRAVVLEKLLVYCPSPKWSPEELGEVYNELLELPRAMGVLEMKSI